MNLCKKVDGLHSLGSQICAYLHAGATDQAGPSAAAAAAANPEGNDDGDEILVEAELGLDDVLARRREEAIRNGQMIDLEADVDKEQIAAAERAIREEEEQRVRDAAQRKRDARLAKLRRRKVCSCSYCCCGVRELAQLPIVMMEIQGTGHNVLLVLCVENHLSTWAAFPSFCIVDRWT